MPRTSSEDLIEELDIKNFFDNLLPFPRREVHQSIEFQRFHGYSSPKAIREYEANIIELLNQIIKKLESNENLYGPEKCYNFVVCVNLWFERHGYSLITNKTPIANTLIELRTAAIKEIFKAINAIHDMKKERVKLYETMAANFYRAYRKEFISEQRTLLKEFVKNFSPQKCFSEEDTCLQFAEDFISEYCDFFSPDLQKKFFGYARKYADSSGLLYKRMVIDFQIKYADKLSSKLITLLEIFAKDFQPESDLSESDICMQFVREFNENFYEKFSEDLRLEFFKYAKNYGAISPLLSCETMLTHFQIIYRDKLFPEQTILLENFVEEFGRENDLSDSQIGKQFLDEFKNLHRKNFSEKQRKDLNEFFESAQDFIPSKRPQRVEERSYQEHLDEAYEVVINRIYEYPGHTHMTGLNQMREFLKDFVEDDVYLTESSSGTEGEIISTQDLIQQLSNIKEPAIQLQILSGLQDIAKSRLTRGALCEFWSQSSFSGKDRGRTEHTHSLYKFLVRRRITSPGPVNFLTLAHLDEPAVNLPYTLGLEYKNESFNKAWGKIDRSDLVDGLRVAPTKENREMYRDRKFC